MAKYITNRKYQTIDIKDTLTINVKIKSLNNYKILFQKLKRAARYAVRHKIPLEIEIVEN